MCLSGAIEMEDDLRKVITALAVTAATLSATTAFAENTSSERSAEMQRTFDRIEARAATRSGFLTRIFGGIKLGFTNPGRAETGSSYGRNLRRQYDDPVQFWPGNIRGTRMHGLAGR